MLTIINNKIGDKQITKLKGRLCGIDALGMREDINLLLKEETNHFHLDLSEVSDMDLTGFNAIVMLKKELDNRGKELLLIASKENSVHEYIHLSKLSFHCLQANSH